MFSCMLKRHTLILQLSYNLKEVGGGLIHILNMVLTMIVAIDRGGATQFTQVKSGEEKIYVIVQVRPLSTKEVVHFDVFD